MQTYAGIDLHSSNSFVGVINEKDKILYGKRHPNPLENVLRALRIRSRQALKVWSQSPRSIGIGWQTG